MRRIRKNLNAPDWQENFKKNVCYVIEILKLSKAELSRDAGNHSGYWSNILANGSQISLNRAVNISVVANFSVDDLIKNPVVFERIADRKLTSWEKRIADGERRKLRKEIKDYARSKKNRCKKGKQRTTYIKKRKEPLE